jgi:hypothetical protein
MYLQRPAAWAVTVAFHKHTTAFYTATLHNKAAIVFGLWNIVPKELGEKTLPKGVTAAWPK